MSTDKTFFTNEPNRDLYSRFSAILRTNTQFFDMLVGYFRTSGFFKLYPAMEKIEKIRVLVGLKVDRYTVKIIDQANQEITFDQKGIKEGKEIVAEEVEKEFLLTAESAQVEQGVRVFVDWLKSGKLEMRMYTKAPVHAKVYIMRKNQELSPDYMGSVITGSSNFSEAGLQNNLEFNVELKNSYDLKFALERFETLWQESVDINETFIDAINTSTWLRQDITPYQLYLKTLYEFFKEEINADKENFDTLLPPGYMRLKYQIDAVIQAKQKLEAYNGVFISDVVGLGKTYICAMLANTFSRRSYKLIICPPVLKSYWESVLKEFDVSRCDVESLGKLDKINEKGTEKYDYVFVDEAHRFRNSDTESFAQLHQICHGKKVILVSATPLNNYTADIENQIYLFQSKQNGTINGIKNIEGFFSELRSRIKKLEKGTTAYMRQLRANAEVIRDRLLREVMVRRTRAEISEYYQDDLKAQGLTFPVAGTPEKLLYTFDETIEESFTETMNIIRNFRYARYMPLMYLRDKKKYATMLIAQKNMGGFMRGILVKRLESSFYAFRRTLSRFVESYESFLKMIKSGKVYISKKVNVYDLLDDGRLDKLMYLIEHDEIMEFSSTKFETRFIRDLEYDLADLSALETMWEMVTRDPKLDEFKRQLTTNKVMKGKKIIVFTESKETAEYLCDNLRDIYGRRVINYSANSSERLKVQIEESFNPKFIKNNNDKFDLLITTDVLAEGVNLHMANVLVNYDLPWNPTRIMQRVGRINRVGTQHDRIYVFNCFPTAQSKAELPLEDRILEKLQAFHDTLGDDIRYLSEDEDVSAKKLFDNLNKNIDEDETGTNPELEYLAIIRNVRDENPQLFEQIKRMPLKIKAGKSSDKVAKTATLTFLRKGALKAFFKTDADNTRHLSFIEAVQDLKAEENESALPVTADYYEQLKCNNSAFDDFLLVEEEVCVGKVSLRGNAAKIVNRLKFMRNEPTLTDSQEAKIDCMIGLWSEGALPDKISKEVMKCCNSILDTVELFYEIEKLVPRSYFDSGDVQNVVEGKKQTVLSSQLIGGGEA